MENIWAANLINGEKHFFTEENFKKYSWHEHLKQEHVPESEDNKNSLNGNSIPKTSLQNNELVENRNEVAAFKKHAWPFPTPVIPYPKKSSLKKTEHMMYLKLNEKKLHNLFLSKKDLILYQQLQVRVKKEQEEFNLFAKQVANENHDTYSYIHPEAHLYIKELLKNHYRRVFYYPRYYSLEAKIVLEEKITSPSFKCIKTLLQMGDIPRTLLPTMKQKATVSLNYEKIVERYPIGDKLLEQNGKYLYKKTVSRDPNAEQLAKKYQASIVISSSSLKTLCDSLAVPCTQSWEIPLIVKEFQDNENMLNVVFIDKTLPPKGMLPYKRNQLYHKYALKRLLLHPKFGKTRHENFMCSAKKSPETSCEKPKEESIQDDDLFGSEDISHLETFGNEVNSYNNFSSSSVTSITKSADFETEEEKNNISKNVNIVRHNNDHNENEHSSVSNHSEDVLMCTKDNSNSEIQKNVIHTENDNNSKQLSVDPVYSSHSDSDNEVLVIDTCAAVTNQLDVEVDLKEKDIDRSTSQINNEDNSDCRDKNKEKILNDKKEKTSYTTDNETPKINHKFSETNDSKKENLSSQHTTFHELSIKNQSNCIMTRSRALAIMKMREQKEKKLCEESSKKIELKNSKIAEESQDNLLHEVFGESSSEDELLINQNSNTNKKGKFIASSSNKKIPLITDETSHKPEINPLDKILAMQEETLKNFQSTPSQIFCKNKMDHHFTSNSALSSDVMNGIEDASNFMSPPNERNISYRLWALENLTLLIRCSVDGKIPPSTNKCQSGYSCVLFPKMEYQCAYGGEMVTEKEKILQWISSKIRLNSKIIQVRINSSNSEIMAIEEIDNKDLSTLVEKKVLSVLHEILCSLNKLTPGQYILSRNGEDPCLNLFKHIPSGKRGDLDLHSSYNFFIEEIPPPIQEIPWLPIDTSVIFRHHKILNWIPGTFELQDGRCARINRKRKKKAAAKQKKKQ